MVDLIIMINIWLFLSKDKNNLFFPSQSQQKTKTDLGSTESTDRR